MSLFRRTFSRRLPDHLQEISECIYVFDSCLSTSTISENEFKSYLGRVVASLQRFHAGASFMVFNFREGDQISLLSDILIDYDMTVVDYPRNHEGYPLLPLEMINYFLRSSESWLSLAGQKNVILMHCEKGGWPVLAFMLAGLLLYRKQYTGEQKTLEMVYKQAPKQVFSVLSPINARASQLRYLKYITGRDLGSDWPPPDAPLVVNYLVLYNLPLFDGGKGCRPVVRVYGQDPLEKADRGPRLLLSTLMAEEPAWLYPKDECIAVKLELRCQVQGDVFLECIHLYDDLVTEELIFKVMFHTGFIQSNFLALNYGDIDVPWNAKHQLPKDFKAEVLFRDINEAPPQVTMELEIGEEYHDSDNEFFEVEEIFTPLSSSPEKKMDLKILIDQNASMLESKSRDCTLHNGAPRWDLETEVSALSASREIVFDGGVLQKASEILHHMNDLVVTEVISFEERDIGGQPKQSSENEADEGNNKQGLGEDPAMIASKNFVVDYRNSEQASDLESDINASKNIVMVDDRIHKQASENDSDISAPTLGSESGKIASKNIGIVDDRIHKQASENEPYISAPTSGSESGIVASRNIVIVDDMIHKQASEKESDTSASTLGSESGVITSRNIVIVDDRIHKQASKKESEISVPISGSESVIIASRNIVMDDDRIHKQASEKESEISVPTSGSESSICLSKNIVIDDDRIHKQASEKESEVSVTTPGSESGIIASRNIVNDDDRIHKKASEEEVGINAPISGLESGICLSKNIVMENDWNYNQASEKESDIGAPTSGLESGIIASENIVMDYDRIQKPTSEKELGISPPISGTKSGINVSKNIVMVDDRNYNQASEKESDMGAPPTSGLESGITAPENIVTVDDRIHQKESEIESVIIAPTSGLKSGLIESKNIVMLDDRNYKPASEKESEISAPTSRLESDLVVSNNIVMVNDKIHTKASETESIISASENIVVVDTMNHKEASETHSLVVVVNMDHKEASETQSEAETGEGHGIQPSRAEFVTSMLKNIEIDDTNQMQALETKLDIRAPASESESSISVSKNIVPVDDMYHKQALETKSDISSSENVVVPDIRIHEETSETQPGIEADGGHDIQASKANFFTSVSRNIVVDPSDKQPAPEKEMDVSEVTSASKNIVLIDDMYHKQASEIRSEICATEKIAVVDIKDHEEASETHSKAEVGEGHDMQSSGAEFVTSVLKNIVVDDTNRIQALENLIDVIVPSSGEASKLSGSKNIVLVDDIHHKQTSEIISDIMADIRSQEEALELLSDGEAYKGREKQDSEAELVTSVLKNIIVDDSNHKQALEKEMDVSGSKSIVLVDDRNKKQVSDIELDIGASNNIIKGDIKNAKEAETQSGINASTNDVVIVDKNHKQASDIKPEVNASKNIVVVDDGSQIQEVKVEIEPKFVPSSSKTKQNKRNKWQEMTAKTITQQRVVSQWVPRTRQQAPEPTKPKPTTYKWVPKGATTPSGEK